MTKSRLPLPDAVLDGDVAILGRKGGGKTVTAKNLVERCLDLGRRVIVLDPLGVWAGLRTSADGTKAGYRVAVFGGEHADLPIDPAAATPLAATLAAENLPAVVDVSELSKADQGRFVGAFLDELRRVNREALTLVLEEADVFAPQNPLGDDSKRVHAAVDWIARRGRFRGFRLVTVSQRPARLSKDVLTQASTLIVHRLPAPQDRDAVKAWVEGNGDRDQARTVFDTLSGLEVGEAWVYAPEHQLLERMRFPLMKTLDTSATPKAGEARIEPKSLAQVDVSAIRAALEAAADTAAMRKTSSRSAARKNAPTDDQGATLNPAELDARIAQAEAKGYELGIDHGVILARQQLRVVINGAVADFATFVGKRLNEASIDVSPAAHQLLKDVQGPSSSAPKTPPIPSPPPPPPSASRLTVARAALDGASNRTADIPAPQRKILDALAWWQVMRIGTPTLNQVGHVAGYKQGGTFDRYRSALRSAELIDYPAPGRMALTPAGASIARAPTTRPTKDAFHAAVRQQLSGPLDRLFAPLIEAWPGELTIEELAAAAGYSPGGTFDRYRSALRSLDILDYPRPGTARASDWLFPGEVHD